MTPPEWMGKLPSQSPFFGKLSLKVGQLAQRVGVNIINRTLRRRTAGSATPLRHCEGECAPSWAVSVRCRYIHSDSNAKRPASPLLIPIPTTPNVSLFVPSISAESGAHCAADRRHLPGATPVLEQIQCADTDTPHAAANIYAAYK